MRVSVKDYVVTLSSGVTVSFYSFVILKLVLVNYGEQALEFFSILKRYQVFFVPLMLLGFGVTLPKYLAQQKISRSTALVSLLLASICFVVFLAIFMMLKSEYYLAVLLTLPALAAGFIYSFARGMNLFAAGACLNVLFLVVLPTIVFVTADSVSAYVLFYSICSAFLFLFIVFLYRERTVRLQPIEPVSTSFFVKSSVARVPGDFLNQGMFLLPVQIYLNRDNPAAAAHLSIALSFVAACAIPLKPISTILLVKVSMENLNPKGNRAAISLYCVIAFLVAAAYRCFTGLIDSIYFNDPAFLSVLNSLTILVFFYAIYVLTRSYVDALYSGPVLSYVNLVGFAVGGLAYFILGIKPELVACLSFGITTGLAVYLVMVKRHA